MNKSKFLMLSAIFFAFAVPKVAVAEETSDQMFSFRTGLVSAVQSSGGYSVAPFLSWNPQYLLRPGHNLVGDLGATVMINSQGNRFSVMQYGLLSQHPMTTKLALEIGLGGQFWSGTGGNVNAPVATVNIVRGMSGEILSSLLGGVSVVWVRSATTVMLRVGVGI
jgi:hypothetical protein